MMHIPRERSLRAVALMTAVMTQAAWGQGTPTLASDEQTALALAEKVFPSLFAQAGAVQATQGYTYRYYAAGGIYVGFKDKRVYVMGGPFGSGVQDKGSVTSVIAALQLSQARLQSTLSNEPVPVLQNLGLQSLDSIKVDLSPLRDFKANGRKGFYLFGDPLPGPGNRRNPNFEYSSLKEGTKVVAALDAEIAFIRFQSESNDYEVFLQTRQNSAWSIGYDHLLNLTVRQGDKVKAGDVLGEPQRQGDGELRFELQINLDIGTGADRTTHFCPTFLLAPAVKDQLTAELKKIMDNWETLSGYELYDPASHNPIGCTKPTMPVAESEGQAG